MFEEGNKEGMDTEEIVDAILHNIYGVEKDPALYAAAIERLDKILEDHGARPVEDPELGEYRPAVHGPLL